MTLNAEYTWALKQSKKHAEKCFLKFSLTLLRQKAMSPPEEFYAINKVMCVAITGRLPEDIIADVHPNWKKLNHSKLIEATETHIEDEDWPTNPFNCDIAFGSLQPDEEVALEAQEWVFIARAIACSQEPPEDIIDAMKELENSMGWGVVKFDHHSTDQPTAKLTAFANAAPRTSP